MAYPAVELVKPLERAILRGHPWLYQRALGRMPPRVRPGQLVRVVRDGAPIAIGFAQPGQAIAVRILATAPDVTIDTEWLAARARRAIELRLGNPRLASTDAFRLVHGENDGLPGLVVDCYAGAAVVVFDGACAHAFWQRHMPAIVNACQACGVELSGVLARAVRGGDTPEQLLAGTLPTHDIVIQEGAARFSVDIRRGQKTGFFLDQRDNRAYVARFADGARVLNLFAYTGGFSVHAALAGARRVTTLDLAKPAIRTAKRNFDLNDIDPSAHEFVAADAFEYLMQARAEGRRFDIVICDPPSFAPNARSLPRAIRAYKRLNALALDVVARDGLLATASCSSHLTTPMLSQVLAEAACETGRVVRTLAVRGAAVDHPTLAGFPEGDYLSFLLVHAE